MFARLPWVGAVENSWATIEPMPTARSSVGIAVVDGKIYAIGGFNGSGLSTNEMYDPETDTWTTKASMPTARSGFGIAVVDEIIYVIGGSTQYDAWSYANEAYDPATDTWKTKASLPESSNYVCANAVNGKVYLISGLATYLPPYFSRVLNQVYDPQTDSWNTETPIPNPVHDYASSVVDDKIYILGGRNINTDPQDHNITQIYNPETGIWDYGKPIPILIHGASSGATSGVLAPKRIHLLKGDIHYVYNPDKGSWTSGTSMLTLRFGASLAVVKDELYVIGGYDGENYRTENEKYTPVGYIPEFPSWAILPLFLVATFCVVIFKKRFSRGSMS